jgi:hypothetical protein
VPWRALVKIAHLFLKNSWLSRRFIKAPPFYGARAEARAVQITFGWFIHHLTGDPTGKGLSRAKFSSSLHQIKASLRAPAPSGS